MCSKPWIYPDVPNSVDLQKHPRTSRNNFERIFRVAVDTGLGAEALWKILKRDTDKKLHKMDGKIPIEWKVNRNDCYEQRNSYSPFQSRNL